MDASSDETKGAVQGVVDDGLEECISELVLEAAVSRECE